MSVELEPAKELAFHRPFTQLVKENLYVRNGNAEPVAFKVKTTAPKQYCVRPNSGRIEPGRSVQVQVLLQPMKEDPPPDFKCKDKFLVQSVAITPEHETMSLQDLWTHIERTSKDLIKEKKIRCIYTGPAEGDAPEERNRDSFPPPYEDQFQTSTVTYGVPEPEKQHFRHQDSGEGSFGGHDSSRRNSDSSWTAGKNQRNEEPVSSTSEIEMLRRELAEARDTIRRLEQQARDEPSMRNRKHAPESDIPGYPVRTEAKIPEGYYPVPVVAAAAAAAFVFGVMFF